VAQWLGCQSIAGSLSLMCAQSVIGRGDHFVGKVYAIVQSTQPSIFPGLLNESNPWITGLETI